MDSASPDGAAQSQSNASQNLLGSGMLYALATVAPILSTLLLTPIITRMLGATEYGVVGIGITLYQMVSIAISLGLPASITRHAIIAKSGVGGAVGMVLVGSGLTALIGIALILTTPFWGQLVLHLGDPAILAFPIVSAIGLGMLTLCQSLFRALDRVVTFVTMGVLSAVAGPVLGLVSVLINGGHAANFLAGLSMGHLVAGLVALVVTQFIQRPIFTRADLVSNLRIGFPTVPHSIASALLVSTLVILAARFGSVADAGRLQLALLLGTAPLVLLGAFNNSWAPMIYRASDEARPQLLKQTTKTIAVLVFLLVAGFGALGQPVIAFIAGPDLFTPEMLTTAVLTTIATPFMALYLANIHLVFLSGRTTLLALATPLSLAIALGCVILTANTLTVVGLATFALGIPVFHALQWMMGSILCKRSGYELPRVLGALPTLALSAVVAVIVALTQPPFWLTLGVLVGLCTLVVLLNRRALWPIRELLA